MTIIDAPVRELTVDDLPKCLDLARDREWPAEAAKWLLLFDLGEVFGIDDPAGGLAATAIVTHQGEELAAISMVLVAARFNRRGLGRRVMTRALAAAGADRTTFLYATELGRPLYETLGFRAAGGVETHTGTCPNGSGGARTAPAADVPGIRALDAEVIGVERRPLLDRLLGDLANVCVVADGDRVTGYAVGTPGETYTMIGPVVADDPAAARSLIRGVASRAPGSVRVDLRAGEAELSGWLAADGLPGRSGATLMVHGDRVLPGDRTRLYAPIGPALG
ncbi:GNAT family N-acetyltransferase [Amycolatopsis anabasis]|uniref:GNAT family N-acetyltransferase n=1 Tax=Amycolatopsis anabasis TaxID=1840409 RepID=UPI001FE2D2AD|nr:GNAT family N-acetyltransferase [Amycolatopsis anabasis]